MFSTLLHSVLTPTSSGTPFSLSMLCKINVVYGISKTYSVRESLGHTIKAVFGPAGSIISSEGSTSVNKIPCYLAKRFTQDVLSRMLVIQ